MCHLKYDIIGKMDTFQKDSDFILTKIGMNLTNQEPLHVSSGESSEDTAIKYFAKLSHKMIQKLYELYKIDFEMFDYDLTF